MTTLEVGRRDQNSTAPARQAVMERLVFGEVLPRDVDEGDAVGDALRYRSIPRFRHYCINRRGDVAGWPCVARQRDNVRGTALDILVGDKRPIAERLDLVPVDVEAPEADVQESEVFTTAIAKVGIDARTD